VKSSTGIEIIPNEMVPLQIDLAIGVRRYQLSWMPDPAVRGSPS
jgi:hypothetical protein